MGISKRGIQFVAGASLKLPQVDQRVDWEQCIAVASAYAIKLDII